MAVYTTIDNPELHFQVKLYTGTGSEQAVTLDGDEDMAVNLWWMKRRDSSGSNKLYDSIRGAVEELYLETTGVEYTFEGDSDDPLRSFDSDGFTLGTDASANGSSRTFVTYCWKASGSSSAHTDGTIDSTRDTNTTSKFSIISYTGDGNDDATVGHGLGATPDLIWNKVRSSASNWTVFHSSLADGYNLNLDTTDATYSGDYLFDVTASLFKLKGHIQVNRSSATQIAYAWKAVQGFSKFGKYTGNGNADGPFVYTGFRPALVLVKNASAVGDPYQFDNKRDPFNDGDANAFSAADPSAEWTGEYCDLLSNGFKIRHTTGAVNGSGNTLVYWAWAEAPFVNSEGVPCNAR